MPIPSFNELGLLPEGLYACSVDEIRERLGVFETTSRRVELFRSFEQFLDEVRSTQLIAAIVLDGSFVTSNPRPNDLDIVVILHAGHDYTATLRPYSIDMLVAETGSVELDEYLSFFAQVRGEPDRRKGLLMVRL